MADPIAQRILDVARQELARTLAELCATVGAAESSILLPRGEEDLYFFASNNPALLGPAAPLVPTGASFTGLAFRTGQTIASADAAGQEMHNKSVDAHVGFQTHEFAAIPIYGESVVGVLTLVNRPAGSPPRPFAMDELKQATALAQELGRPLALLATMAGGAAPDSAGTLDPDLVADLVVLTEPERRIVQGLANSLQQNRAP